MLKDIIAKRYAKALLSLAGKPGETAVVKADLAAVAGTFAASKSLQSVYMNPVFSTSDRVKVLEGLMAEMKVSKLSARFLDMLAKKRRFGLIREVSASYSDLLDVMQGRVKATVTTAEPLSDSELAKLSGRIRTMVGKEVELNVDVDPSLIGGVRTRIGSTLYDGSVANQLGQLRKALLES
ncbi:MAG TPA: ATP synthase F1 subunit delta [Nitrospirota bacterium]|jgi:F-type H+-transporting ATPase subunit delta